MVNEDDANKLVNLITVAKEVMFSLVFVCLSAELRYNSTDFRRCSQNSVERFHTVDRRNDYILVEIRIQDF